MDLRCGCCCVGSFCCVVCGDGDEGDEDVDEVDDEEEVCMQVGIRVGGALWQLFGNSDVDFVSCCNKRNEINEIFLIFSEFSVTFFVGETSAEGCTGDVTRFQPLLRRQEFAVAVVVVAASCRCSSRSFSLDTTAGDGGCCVDIALSLASLAIRAQLMLSLRTTLDSSSRR